jgi:hypothetical protein
VREEMYKILVAKSLDNGHLENQKGNGRIILKWILWKQVLRMGVRRH